MVINVHAGHNPANKIACGAVGILNESTEARKIKDLVITKLRYLGNTVYDCTVDDGLSQNDVLTKIVKKCNAHKVDLDVSIHLNSGRNDYAGDGSVGGTEVFIYSTTAGALQYAQRTVRAISELGFPIRDDRIKDDVKTSTALYVLRETNAPAMLVECCFVDDKDDANRYNAEKMADAIVKGINNTNVVPTTTPVTYVKDTRLSNEEVAKKVYNGEYGNQPERQRKLEAEGYDYETIRALVNKLASGQSVTPTSQVSAPTINYYPRYTGDSGSIVTGLNSIGVNSSYSNRCSIAAKNGISGYKGTADQNTYMLNLLKAGKLIK